MNAYVFIYDEPGALSAINNKPYKIVIPAFTLADAFTVFERQVSERACIAEVYPYTSKLPEQMRTFWQLDWLEAMDRAEDAERKARITGYKPYFAPDWSKYPKLASVFEARPTVNVYWAELRELIIEARADAVQYVKDVKAEELAKARADERARIGRGG